MRKVKLMLFAILGLVVLLSPFIEVLAQGASSSRPSPPPPPPLNLWSLIGVLLSVII